MGAFYPQAAKSIGDLSPVDIVFWLDSSCEVLVEAILPIMKIVMASGLHVALITPADISGQLDEAIKYIQFQVAYTQRLSTRWKRGWDVLRARYSEDLSQELYTAFCDMGYTSDNSAHEIERLLTALRPRLLVLPADNLLPGSAACVVARQMGIESLGAAAWRGQPLQRPSDRRPHGRMGCGFLRSIAKSRCPGG